MPEAEQPEREQHDGDDHQAQAQPAVIQQADAAFLSRRHDPLRDRLPPRRRGGGACRLQMLGRSVPEQADDEVGRGLGELQPLLARGAARQVLGQPVEVRPGHAAMREGRQLVIGRTGTLEHDFLRVMPKPWLSSRFVGAILLRSAARQLLQLRF